MGHKNKHGRTGVKKEKRPIEDPDHARYQKGYEAGYKVGVALGVEERFEGFRELLKLRTAREMKSFINVRLAQASS